MNEVIGLKIKELRKEKKLTQKTFSNKIGIDDSQLSKIEQGKLMPTLIQLLEISSIFNISMDWLTGRDNTFPTSEYKQNNNNEIISLLRDKITLLESNNQLQADKIADLEEKLKFAEFRDKKDMDFKIKAQRKEIKDIISEKDEIINLQNEEINALKSRYLPPDEPLQPSKGL